MEFTLLWAALLGVAALYAALRWQGRRDDAVPVRDLWETALSAVLIGLFVGRVVAMLRNGTSPFTHPADLLIIRGGVDPAGASLAALAAVAVRGRKALPATADALAAAALAGLGGWHLGCLFRSACLGTPSSLPWAFAQPGSDITRHPVELYAGLLLLASAVALAWRPRPWRAAGARAGLALATAGTVRLSTEPLRPVLGNGPLLLYAAAIAAGLGLAALALAAYRRKARSPGSPPMTSSD